MTTSSLSGRTDEPATACDLSGAGVAKWLVRGVEYLEKDPLDEQLDGVADESESPLATAVATEALLGRPREHLTIGVAL